MKKYEKAKWEAPRIFVQQFTPNEYYSACYAVTCITPRNNGDFVSIYADSNGNGRWDRGVDRLLYNAYSNGYDHFNGDNVKEYTHSYPKNNGFVVDSRGNSYPVFYFYKNEGSSNIHVADLTNSKNTEVGADISTPEHPNHS